MKYNIKLNTTQMTLHEMIRLFSSDMQMLDINRILPNGEASITYTRAKYLNVWC